MHKAFAKIFEKYVWPGRYSETLECLKKCDLWQRIKPNLNNQVRLVSRRIIKEPLTGKASDMMHP